WRRVGGGVRDRSREIPRGFRRGPANRADGVDGRHPTAHRRAGVLRAIGATRLEGPAVLGCGRDSRQGGRRRRGPFDGSAGRGHHQGGSWLPRDHGLRALGCDRGHPRSSQRGRVAEGRTPEMGGDMLESTSKGAAPELPVEGQLPELDGATAWLNAEALTPGALRGKVVLVEFCTYSCVNWLRTLPYVRSW